MQFFLGKSIEEVPLGKRIYLPVLDKKFHADLISDLYTEKFEEDTKSSEGSYESPFMSRIFGGKEAVPRNFSFNIEFDNFKK